jgi:hypothetical protein
MVWDALQATPALGFWGTLLLGAVLALVAVRLLPRGRPRTTAALGVGLALFVPALARATIPYTFSNGTVADANQVNTNFATVGTTGQSASMVFQTGALAVTNSSAATMIPGLADTVTMPAVGAFHVNVCGTVGIATTSEASTGFSGMSVAFDVDSARTALSGGGEGVVGAANPIGAGTWSQCYTFTAGIFAAGSTHTFQMSAMGLSLAGGSTATVGGSSGNLLQGQLSVEVVKE